MTGLTSLGTISAFAILIFFFTLLMLLASQVHAHKPSDSYLQLTPTEQGFTGEWRIALRDLEPAIGLERLRISLDTLPVDVPAAARDLPDPELVKLFASVVPQMVVPYADAAGVMLANLNRVTRCPAIASGWRGSSGTLRQPNP